MSRILYVAIMCNPDDPTDDKVVGASPHLETAKRGLVRAVLADRVDCSGGTEWVYEPREHDNLPLGCTYFYVNDPLAHAEGLPGCFGRIEEAVIDRRAPQYGRRAGEPEQEGA